MPEPWCADRGNVNGAAAEEDRMEVRQKIKRALPCGPAISGHIPQMTRQDLDEIFAHPCS